MDGFHGGSCSAQTGLTEDFLLTRRLKTADSSKNSGHGSAVPWSGQCPVSERERCRSPESVYFCSGGATRCELFAQITLAESTTRCKTGFGKSAIAITRPRSVWRVTSMPDPKLQVSAFSLLESAPGAGFSGFFAAKTVRVFMPSV